MKKKAVPIPAFEIDCNECGATITARTNADLNIAKLEHIYQEHPLKLIQNILQAVPKVRSIGVAVGQLFRENLKP